MTAIGQDTQRRDGEDDATIKTRSSKRRRTAAQDHRGEDSMCHDRATPSRVGRQCGPVVCANCQGYLRGRIRGGRKPFVLLHDVDGEDKPNGGRKLKGVLHGACNRGEASKRRTSASVVTQSDIVLRRCTITE